MPILYRVGLEGRHKCELCSEGLSVNYEADAMILIKFLTGAPQTLTIIHAHI